MAIHLLNPRSVYRLDDGIHADGAGLFLRVQTKGTARSWAFRYVKKGKRRQISLGPLSKLDIYEARDKASQLNQTLIRGGDPAEALADKKEKAERVNTTFGALLPDALADIEFAAQWRSSKSALQWRTTLETYALPKLGKLEINSITPEHIIKVLLPIWGTKTETAKRVLGRLHRVFSWAIAKGFCTNKNPAEWSALRYALPAPSKIQKVEHHAAVPLSDMPRLFSLFWEKNTVSGNAILFGVLTATRVNEFRLAKWEEIDLKAKLWTMPSCRRKDGQSEPHRVPLSDTAIELLKRTPRTNDFLFPGQCVGSISLDTPRAVLRKNGYPVTMHGMRSVFRDWCAETKQDWVASEKALCHAIGNQVTRAYLRTDMLEERAKIMQDWAAFLTGKKPLATGASSRQ